MPPATPCEGRGEQLTLKLSCAISAALVGCVDDQPIEEERGPVVVMADRGVMQDRMPPIPDRSPQADAGEVDFLSVGGGGCGVPAGQSTIEAPVEEGGTCIGPCRESNDFMDELSACRILGEGEEMGTYEIECVWEEFCGVGRWSSLAEPALGTERLEALARAIAHRARLERVAVKSFEWLAVELRAYGAPESLIEAAPRAAIEEQHHAELVEAEAASLGAAPLCFTWDQPSAARPLFEIAVENVVEGCVGESYGAAEAAYQARYATRPNWRRVAAELAPDELSHAALSWRLHRWLYAQLSEVEQAQLDHVMHEAVDALEARTQGGDEVAEKLGLLSGERRRSVIRTLRAQIWGDVGAARIFDADEVA
ncbi:MAG: hypothetical protein VYD19_10550 [Myxococcota bacterium]|nr:hypothetical protein [Myxococcota bacterium]